MYGLTIDKIAAICEGSITGIITDTEIEPRSISIDSRSVADGDIFAAFRGEQTDGNAYIEKAFENGAAACITDRLPDHETSGTIILVKDVQKAIESIASEFRKMIDIPIVGITGSVGKTTAKEMIAAVLSLRFNVLKTDGNYNNQLGVPITLSRIQKEHEIAVVEMGVSKVHDMDLLGDLVRPEIGVFTSIGRAHLEFLKDLEGVFREKTKMLNYMDEDALVVVNSDDAMLSNISFRGDIIRCGIREKTDFTAENISFTADGSTEFDISAEERIDSVTVSSFGMHYVSDALLAAAVGRRLGLSGDEIKEGISSFRNINRRGDLIRNKGFLIIDDSYNANPESVRSAIDSMLLLQGRHICILGDMLELGSSEVSLHFETGRYASEKGVDMLFTLGPLAAYISEGFGNGMHFEALNDLISELISNLRKNDIILIKASRGMHFERITEALKNI